MQTRYLLLTLGLLMAIIGFAQEATAQRIPIDTLTPVPLTIEHDTSGYVPIYCNSASGADAALCDSEAADGNLGVDFFLTVAAINPVDYGCPPGFVDMMETENFRNNTSCEINFVTCSMVEYAEPIRDELDTVQAPIYNNINGDSVGFYDTVTAGEDFGTSLVCWTLTSKNCDTCSTGCYDSCSPGGADFVHDWSYYFGCKDVDIPPGQTVTLSDFHSVDAPILATHGDPSDTGTLPITLSQKQPYNPTDAATTTWNYRGTYMDFVKGCQFLKLSGCDFGDEPGQEVALPTGDKRCAHPLWHMTGSVDLRAYRGRGYPTGIVSFPIGNQATATMTDSANAYTVYPAKFEGMLIGAPADAELMIYAPVDTSGGACVIDSGWLWTHALSGCVADTLKFSFPFAIPPRTYLNRGMTFVLYFPSDSCSNVGNGKRIYLNGQVVANGTTPLYDSADYMYNVQGTMILDTTPPVITNFVATPVDSTHLAINMTGIDDTTMITVGFVVYTINGGSKQLMPLRFANNLAVGDTTIFKDTLVTSVSSPTIDIKGFVQNEVGLTDSSMMIILPLPPGAQPQDVKSQQDDSLKVNYLFIDHQSKMLTLDVQADGAPIELDLVTEDGQSTKLTSESSSPNGEQKFVQSISNFAHGAYFLVIRSGGNSIIENIIL